jgi:hypothetical protein
VASPISSSSSSEKALRLPKELMAQVESLSTTDYWQFRFYCDNSQWMSDSPQIPRTTPEHEALAWLLEAIDQHFSHCPRCQSWVRTETEWEEDHRLCYKCIHDVVEGIPLKNLGENPEPRKNALKVYQEILGEGVLGR